MCVLLVLREIDKKLKLKLKRKHWSKLLNLEYRFSVSSNHQAV